MRPALLLVCALAGCHAYASPDVLEEPMDAVVTPLDAIADAGTADVPVDAPDVFVQPPTCTFVDPGRPDVFALGFSGMSEFSCAPGQSRSLQGRLIAIFAREFRLGSCSTLGPCPTTDLQVEIDAIPSLFPLGLPNDGFVTVTVNSPTSTSGCTATLAVRSLPTWQGRSDPAMAGERLYALAGTGPTVEGDTSPFRVSYVAEHCGRTATTPGCDAPDEYALHVVTDDGAAIDVVPGGQQMMQAVVGGVRRTYRVVNVVGQRPSLGACNDEGRWGWVIYEPAS